MSKGRKTGGKDFEKGKPGGPGRPPLPMDLKDVKKLSKEEIERRFAQLWMMPLGELAELSQNVMAPTGLALMARVLHMAWVQGDHARAQFVLDRTIGKVAEKIEQTTTIKVLPSMEEARQMLREDPATNPPLQAVVVEDLD